MIDTNKLDKWLDEVATKCNELASNKDFNLDFYVFQSAIKEHNPKLMFIGANPGGNKEFSRKRQKNELGEGVNTFIKYYDDPDWSKLRPLYDMFKDNGELETYFKDAVITNLSYFNSGTFGVLKSKMKVVGREPLDFCIQKNLELITKILLPQNIILLGATARDEFSKYLDIKPFIVVEETKLGVPLIKQSSFTFIDEHKKTIKIPVFIIEHPSAWNGLNNSENVEIKRNAFIRLFCKKNSYR
jgi:hypothetical protein